MPQLDSDVVILGNQQLIEKRFWLDKLTEKEMQWSGFPSEQQELNSGAPQRVEYPFSFPDEITDLILTVSNKSVQLMQTIYISSLFCLLHKLTGNSQLVIATPIIRGSEANAGRYLNTMLPITLSIDPSMTFRALLLNVRSELIEAMKHQNYPVQVLLQQLESHRGTRVIDVALVEDSIQSRDDIDPGLYNVTVACRFNHDHRITGEIIYNPSLYDLSDVERMAAYFLNLIKEGCQDSGLPLDELDFLPQVEKEMLIGFNNRGEKGSRYTTVLDMFDEQVQLHPTRNALIYEGTKLTYLELYERSNRFAHLLTPRAGQQGLRVALMADQSIDALVVILGIIRSGATYVPIDKDAPPERIQYILEDSQVDLLILEDTITTSYKVERPILHFSECNLQNGMPSPPIPIPNAGPAYVIYTSGSSGTPKGVQLEHRGLVNFIEWRRDEYRLYESELNCALQLFPIFFDGFMSGLFTPLVSGITTILVNKEEIRSIYPICSYIDAYKVTHLICVPTLFEAILDTITAEQIKTVKCVTLAGELIQRELYRKSKKLHPSLELYNEYGPTECSVGTTFGKIQSAEATNIIGKPIANTQIYVVSAMNHKQLMPTGVWGELCIAGVGLSRGYLHLDELTKERFIPNPYVPGQNLYKSGDIARWNAYGELELLGRIDNQVKIRGFRIECGEIEHRLRSLESIQDAVVVAKKMDQANALVAYLICNDGIGDEIIRTELRKQLPEYMIPTGFIRLPKFSELPNGKLDLNKLKALEPSTPCSIYEPPITDMEHIVSGVWEKVLSNAEIGVNDHFFELGGHSIHVAKIIYLLEEMHDISLSSKAFFSNPTIRELAAYLESNRRPANRHTVRIDSEGPVYATSAQKRIFILSRQDTASVNYNMPTAILWNETVDIRRVQDVCNKLVMRHESLRTSFKMVHQDLVQISNEKPEFDFYYYEEPYSEQELFKHFIRPFDLQRGPLFRVIVSKKNSSSYWLFIDMHHIISDGGSLSIILSDFFKLYYGGALPPLLFSYKEWSANLSENREAGGNNKQEHYWLDQLKGELPILELPTDFPRPAIKRFEGYVEHFAIEKGTRDALAELAKKNQVTLQMLLFTAYSIFLSKLSGQNDIVIGCPVSGRDSKLVENIVGLFMNTLPIRVGLDNEERFPTALASIKDKFMEMLDHQGFQIDDLLSVRNESRDASRNPLYDALFSYSFMNESDYPDNIQFIKSYNAVSKLDLSLYAVDTSHELQFTFEYSTSLFCQDTIRRWCKQFTTVLESISLQPEQRIREIQLQSAVEAALLINDFNRTSKSIDESKTISILFEEQVKSTPDGIALTFEGKGLTYLELRERVNHLAAKLVASGLRRNDIVGLYTTRSVEMIVGILAALRVGAAYIPIDPAFPKERISYMLVSSGARILITHTSIVHSISFDGMTICLDKEDQTEGNASLPDLSEVNARDLAYIIYTSGSTGKPKGVMIEHRSVVNLYEGIRAIIPWDAGKTILALTTMSFDIFVLEAIISLLAGMRVVIANEQQSADPQEIVRLLSTEQVNIVQLTPSRAEQLILSLKGRFPNSLESVLIGGEPLTQRLLNELKDRTGADIYNMYGPTETTVWSAVKNVTSDTTISIGKPICNTQFYVLDNYGAVRTIGVAGELYIGGMGLARGYFGEGTLTEERFVENPFLPSGLMYRTGDLVRWLPDGELEFLGRADHQVKLRGHRIEIEEIEKAIRDYPGVINAAVTLNRSGESSTAIWAYIVSEENIELSGLITYLHTVLPAYMIPATFIRVGNLPLTPNGKLNRKVLIGLDGTRLLLQDYQAPQTATEERLGALWKDLLVLEHSISIYDDFFEIGGHSLNAMSLNNRINEEFNVNIPFLDLFVHTTIKAQATVIDQSSPAKASQLSCAPQQPYYPLSSEQSRMYMLNQLEADLTNYNMPVFLWLEGALDTDRLRGAIGQLVNRHEALRTTIDYIQGDFYQFIGDAIDVSLTEVRTCEEDIPMVIRNFISPFNLSEAPLIRSLVAHVDNHKHLIILDMHHIAADGGSLSIIADDLAKLYKGDCLPDMLYQYKDYAVWQKHIKEQAFFAEMENYWKNSFIHAATSSNFPTDLTQTLDSRIGRRVATPLSKELTISLKNLAKQLKTTLNAVLLTAYKVLLYGYSGNKDLTIGVPLSSRLAELESVVGLFANTMPIRNVLEENHRFSEIVHSVSRKLIEAIHYRHYQLDWLISIMGLQGQAGRNPLFDTVFVYQNQRELPQWEHAELSYYAWDELQVQFDIQFVVTETNEDMCLIIEYDQSKYRDSTIQKYAEQYLRMVQLAAENQELTLSELVLASMDRDQKQCEEGFYF